MKMIIRSNKLLRSAKGQSCVNCGKKSRTVVAAHYQGIRSHLFGKGKGIKPHDLCIAHLCGKCHRLFDSGEVSFVTDRFQRKVDISERFLFCVVMTQIRLMKMGILKVDDFEP